MLGEGIDSKKTASSSPRSGSSRSCLSAPTHSCPLMSCYEPGQSRNTWNSLSRAAMEWGGGAHLGPGPPDMRCGEGEDRAVSGGFYRDTRACPL